MSGVKGMQHVNRRSLAHNKPKLDRDLVLATRVGTAAVINRHPSEVARHACPVACDAKTRHLLYDVAEVAAIFAKKRRRVA